MIALTRPVSPTLADCQLTHLAREPIDIPRAVDQHAAYERLLRDLGVEVIQVSAAPELADAVFIEDTAVALDEVAIMTRPGAVSRRGEASAVGSELGKHRQLKWMEPPATLDGGDVLQVGHTLFVGQSSRTNEAGIRQLAELLEPWHYRVVPMRLSGCLHLKSAATLIGPNLLLTNPAWLPPNAFPGLEQQPIAPEEPYAANALRIHDTLIYPTHFPRTLDRLLARGLKVVTVDNSELAKAEGAVTCCSIILEDPPITGG